MVGEALREAGVLAIVLIPLDHVFSDQQELSTLTVVAATLVIGMGLFGLGVYIEEKRK